ncbi:MAG: auracyanin family protein [Flavobacteriales bacterium]|nr:auracyanin family protein [Flavobacteriales bacterium]
MKKSNLLKTLLPLSALFFSGVQFAIAQLPNNIVAEEAKYYKIVDVPVPEDIVLEVGGLALTDDNKLGVSTRRGEVWIIDEPNTKNATYSLYAKGLHEALGLAYKDNGFYLSQRGELTRLEDTDGNGKADLFKTIFSWPLSGNYHDYSYGPKILKNGDMIVTLNLGWENAGVSKALWRGWMLKITPEGEMTPIATGLRSPAGFGFNEDEDIFYTENQGDWVGSGRMTHLEVGDFSGNPAGLKWTDHPQSPLKLKPEDIDGESGLTLFEYAKDIPEFKIPAIWFPHGIQGVSTSDILLDNTKGKFGPFEGQMFIGDQGSSKIMRVALEKVNGVYQGVSFPFVEGFSSGVLRMIWSNDNSMFVGMTSRGWASTGGGNYGLQRLVWTGKTPFEMKTIKAQADGFVIEFTKPVNKELASKTSSYEIVSFNYKYQERYGSPIIEEEEAMIHMATVAEDGMSVKLMVHGMRLGYIHQIKAKGVQSKTNESLLHIEGYYTLNEVPGGTLKSPSMTMSGDVKTKKQKKLVNRMPMEWNGKPDYEFKVGTVPGMKFDFEELEVKPAYWVQLTFDNVDDMLHNLVILSSGKKEDADKVGTMAIELGLKGPELNYVPDTDLVLFHTGILQPETSQTIYFVSPEEPGEYWILCTFPGHSVSMRAKLIVK